ncbi:MAG: hypothetical protein M0Q90_08000 [Bacteroidales bacterium]|nr:hypothetical protein [Bacteroidales bacterium]
MKATVKHITLKIVILLMTGVMGLLIANTAIFLHVHKLHDGTIISHAHPYDKESDTHPYKTHQHSKTDLLLIHSLEILFPLIFLSLILNTLEKKTVVLFDLIKAYRSSFFDNNNDRAPPILKIILYYSA